MDEMMTTSACEALMQIIRQDKDKRIAELEQHIVKQGDEFSTLTERYLELEQENERLRDARKLVSIMADIDYEECGDSLCIKLGGDGDNGEQMIYLLKKAIRAEIEK